MSDFQIVDDALRTSVTAPVKYEPVMLALDEGKTVFVPGVVQDKAAGYYNAAKRRGRKLRTSSRNVNGVDGLVMWFDPLPETPAPETPT